jgi:hypothetical protein
MSGCGRLAMSVGILFNSRLATVCMEVDTDLSLLVCPALARVGDGENVTRRGGDLADASPTRRVFQPHCTAFHSTFFTHKKNGAKAEKSRISFVVTWYPTALKKGQIWILAYLSVRIYGYYWLATI